MAQCGSCGAPVVFVRTAKGGWMPLNPKPRAGGNVELLNGVAQVVAPSPEVQRYTAHFEDCPNANGHRRERRR